ncbi:hypothetical protein JCM15765_38620 [Paradesulfitobacterium aromaticivorans]
MQPAPTCCKVTMELFSNIGVIARREHLFGRWGADGASRDPVMTVIFDMLVKG